MVDKENMGMEDAAGFFANVFGGERFKDYVSLRFRYGLNISITSICSHNH